MIHQAAFSAEMEYHQFATDWFIGKMISREENFLDGIVDRQLKGTG
jgi:hypothetical protein